MSEKQRRGKQSIQVKHLKEKIRKLKRENERLIREAKKELLRELINFTDDGFHSKHCVLVYMRDLKKELEEK